MDFWTRVTIEEATEQQTATGNVRMTWESFEEDIEARVLPLDTTETRLNWATPEEDAYEVQLRGAWRGIRPTMRAIIGTDTGTDIYDIRRMIQPPPFGDPVTVLQCVRVTP